MALSQILLLVIPLLLLAALIFKFPELGLVLCLVIGSLLKGIVQPLLGPIDVTVYLFAVTYGSIFIRCCMERKLAIPSLSINIGALVLIALLLASLLYTPLPAQGAEVFLRFVFLTISMLYAIFMWCTNITRIKRLLFIFVGVVLVYAACVLTWAPLPGQEQAERLRASFPGTPAIGVAQLVAAAIPIAFILSNLVQAKKRLLLYALMVIGIVELIVLNSRGPFIAFVTGAVCLLLLYSRGERKRFAPLFIPSLIIIVCALVFLPHNYTARYALVTDIESSSIAPRLEMWKFVAAHFSDWFFKGAGISGFGYYYYPMAPASSLFGAYPHNIFLDVFAAAGIFALLAFVWLIGSLIYRGIRVSRTPEQPFHSLGLASVVPLLVFLVAGLFSMSIIGSRSLWFFGGVILSLHHYLQNDRGKANHPY